MARGRDERRRPAPTGRRGRARDRRHADGANPPRPGGPPPTSSGRPLAFTSRAAVLGLAVCVTVLTLAYPLKDYLGQRTQIAAEVAQQRQLQAEIAHLSAQHQASTDPAQVEQEARERLHYVLPGQRNYIQLAPPPAPAPVPKAGNAAVPTDPGGTWFGRLWRSDETAGGSR